MSRWSARLRRAASLLLGVHLLQVGLLAASAVCDIPGAAAAMHAPHSAQTVVVSADAGHAHRAAVHHAHALHAGADTELPSGQQPPYPSHHAPAPSAACPMAMACTVTAVVAPVPTFATTEVQVATLRVPHTATAPLSLRVAPEPPPPRA